MNLTKKLAKIIFHLFGYKDLSSEDKGKLEDIFFKNLSEVMKIAFDVNLDVEKLRTFQKENGSAADLTKLGEFLAETLEKPETYVILNHYMYVFIKSYLKSIKEDQLLEINEMMLKAGLSEDEVEKIEIDYNELVRKKNSKTLTA